MIAYKFDDSFNDESLKNNEKVSVTFHINTIQWPIYHTHLDYWEFTIVSKGSLINKTATYSTVLKENDLIISSTKSPAHALFQGEQTPFSYINISIKEKVLINLLNTIDSNLINYFLSMDKPIVLPKSIVSDADQKFKMLNPNSVFMRNETDIIIKTVLLNIISYIAYERTYIHLKTLETWQIKLNNLLNSGDLISLNVNSLCKYLGYSRTHINVLFKEHYNTSPHQYIALYKFEYARKMLTHTELTVENIALKIGYSNPTQFYNEFKKKYGVSPKTYRKNQLSIKKGIN